MNEVEKNMAVSALAQLLDQQPTAYAEVLAACRAMGWNASPTAQPADIIDELPSNVLPLIRRMLALLIYGDGSSDSPAVVPVTERCYAQLVPRVTSPNYPAAGFPSDGVRPFLPDAPSIRDFAHLPQALSALSARKITNGNAENDGIADGMSLAHILGVPSMVTEIKDDNADWQMTQAFPWSMFTNLSKVTLGCTLADVAIISGYPNITEFHLPNLKVIGSYPRRYSGDCIYLSGNVEHLVFDSLETWYIHRIWSPSLKTITFKEHVHFYGVNEYNSMFNTNQETLTVTFEKGSTYETTGYNSFLAGGSTNLRKFIAYGLEAVEANNGGCISGSYPALEEVLLPDCHRIVGYSPSFGSSNYANLKRLQFGTIHSLAGWFTLSNNLLLTDIEFGQGTDCSIDLSSWNPTDKGTTFLENFRSHIALRLTDNGSGKTLTLSQAVRNAIHAAESEYGIENIIITKKGWTISPAPN